MDPEIVGYKITKYIDKLKNAKTPEEADLYRERLKEYHSYNKKLLNVDVSGLKTSIVDNCVKCIKLIESGQLSNIDTLEQLNQLLSEVNKKTVPTQTGGSCSLRELKQLHTSILTGLVNDQHTANKLLSSYVNVSNQYPDKNLIKTMTGEIVTRMKEQGIDINSFNTGFAIFSKL